jgi:hypothetical protein
MVVEECNGSAMPIAEEAVVQRSKMTAGIAKDVAPRNKGQRITDEIAHRIVDQPADGLTCAIEDWLHGR